MVRSRPYVGVTGYTSKAQIDEVHHAVRPFLGNRVLMDGLLLWSHDVSERWRRAGFAPANLPKRFVSISEAKRIVAAPSDVSLRLVHFRTLHDRQLDQQLSDCIDRLGPQLDGFQINWLPNPDPQELADFRQLHDSARKALGLSPSVMVLQLHPDVLREASEPSALVRYLEPYVEASAITHALYDPSGGLGRPFDPERASDTLAVIRSHLPSLHLGVAGGLGPDNVWAMMKPVWDKDLTVSIDVEGRVRDATTDDLDLIKTISFLRTALGLSAETNLPHPTVPMNGLS